ncbi:MAG: AhpC/TSA family protein [Bacteroidales bacterium]|nr:AhpC/TSA family protein [Bacteroidales bacterium]MBP5395863.1 AhpC/TSA family protein [Bacteroidales bacterium]
MKRNIIVRFWLLLLLGASFLNVQCAGKKVMFKGIVANYSAQDSVELYDALGRQKAALEKAAVEKGVFKFYYNPVETGYYIVHFPNGKNVLCVLVPDRQIELGMDASNGMITLVKNSPENDLLHQYQQMLLQLEQKKDSLVRAHQETPDPKIQQKMQDLENLRGSMLAKLCWEHADNYASAALLENIRYEQSPMVFDTVFSKLGRKYPNDVYIKHRSDEIAASKFLAAGAMAPDFTLPDTNGVKVALSSFRGKVVVVDFWASWCRPCRQENPNMVRLYSDFHDKGLEILGVSLDGDRTSWMDAIHKDGLYWTQVSDLKRWQCAAAQQYQVTGIPFTVLIDRDGKIVAKGLRGNDLRNKVKELLEK